VITQLQLINIIIIIIIIDKYDEMVGLGLGYNRGLRVLHSAVCQTDGCASWSDVLIRAKGKMNINMELWPLGFNFNSEKARKILHHEI
jgi:hypothetical protein